MDQTRIRDAAKQGGHHLYRRYDQQRKQHDGPYRVQHQHVAQTLVEHLRNRRMVIGNYIDHNAQVDKNVTFQKEWNWD